jgi:uncharacterized protein (TIGR02145 family)
MKQKIYFLIQLILGCLLFQENGFSEGSKEIYIGAYNTWLFMCTDNIGHCNNGGIRTPFATYGCTEPNRLYFSTITNNETVFLGFNASIEAPGNSQNHVVFEIMDTLGNVVYPEINVPTSGTGFITDIGEARVGPEQIYGAAGYTAIDFHPATPGTFYVEFAMRNNITNAFYSGSLDMNLIDVTVQDTVTTLVKPGRLFSKSWQFYENGTHYSGTSYIYSVDSIITSCTCSNMQGGIWVQFCNQWGCQNTGNFPVDRKSTNTQSLLPEYKIFLNNPDSILYPPATTLGQIVPPQPYGIQDCNTGHIVYYVNVDKPGSVEIDLTFGGVYTPRVLTQTVVTGVNQIIWDGLDGTIPVGVPVQNGTSVTFTVKYINGLTNLPFYDIEGNPNGFVVALVNPPGAEPLLYWDDSNIGGSSNFTGCSAPPGGCHTWNNPWGNNRTVNTWWYNVSSTTSPVVIIQFRHSGTLTFVQTPPTLCAGTTGQLFSVNQDPNTDQYHWSYTGTGATIHQVNPSDYFVTVDFAMNATSGNLQVYGTNSNCLAPGPTTSIAVTINPVPVVNPPTPNSICAGVTTNITLTSVPPSTTFSWTSPSPTCSANIVSCPPGQNGINTITDLLNLTNSSPGTVVYHIMSSLNGCTSLPQDFTLTVLPSPVPVITGNNSVCVGSSGNVYSTLPGMTAYTWLVSAGGTITAGSGTNSITVTWNSTGAQSVSVGYTNLSSCPTLIPSVYNITVNPLPSPVIGGPSSVCATSTGNIYSTSAGMSNYQWSISAGGTITSGGSTANNTVTVTWNSPGTQTVSVNFNDANGCAASAPVNYTITVNPLPVPTINGPVSVCLNSSGTYLTEAGMTNYQWLITPDGVITSGIGSNSITILWSTTGAKTITVNYHNANGCTAAVPSVYNVNVNTLPVPSLNGLNNICSGNTTTYNTDVGMNNYQWTVSAGGTITAGGSTADNFVTVTWNVTGAQTVSVNYIMGTGCTAASPTVLNINVKPRPSVTNASNSTICSSGTTNIVLLASLPGTTFTWTPSGSSGNVSGFSPSGGPVITQTLINSGFAVETVDYSVTPTLNGCDGPVADFIVTVDPVADAYFNPNGQTICSGGITNISILSHVAGAVFTWTATGSSGTLGGYGPGSTGTIIQTLTNNGTDPGNVTFAISPSFNSCPGTPSQVIVTVNPLPDVTYTICNDAITTTVAQPFKLRGGLPIGGTYSGTGVNTGSFFPSIAGTGNHIITYSYLNTWGCPATASIVITVVNAPAFICDNTMTDVRDNQQYTTVKIGTQCWMSANLNYGTFISSTQMQRDNCVPEKYCFNNNPANCTSNGGLYQWDEMMQYENVAASQGFCPPGWHIPANNEWITLFNFYISNGFAGAVLKYTGYSGFDAFLSGTRFNNVSWNFNNFATMLWTSTAEGTNKAWAHGMNTYDPSVSFYPSSTTHAFGIRCIKD